MAPRTNLVTLLLLLLCSSDDHSTLLDVYACARDRDNIPYAITRGKARVVVGARPILVAENQSHRFDGTGCATLFESSDGDDPRRPRSATLNSTICRTRDVLPATPGRKGTTRMSIETIVVSPHQCAAHRPSFERGHGGPKQRVLIDRRGRVDAMVSAHVG